MFLSTSDHLIQLKVKDAGVQPSIPFNGSEGTLDTNLISRTCMYEALAGVQMGSRAYRC